MRMQLMIGLLLIASVTVVAAAGKFYMGIRPQEPYQPAPVHLHSNAGAISGRVQTSDGQPVFEAEVLALRADFAMGKVPSAYTDKEGAFRIDDLTPGTYIVSVSKVSENYPPTDYPFHSAGLVVAPQVTVFEGQTSSEVPIYLGPKAAKITGHLCDAATKKLLTHLKDARITLRRIDNPELSFTDGPALSGEFSVLVPPVPLTIEVSAPGYETRILRADNADNPSDSLKLSPGETKRVDIALRRQKQTQ